MNHVLGAGTALMLIALLGSGGSGYADEVQVSESTVENLKHAYQGERNAAAAYSAFAQKAEEEGYGPVAGLFRAAARSEEIHAANHALVLRKMGAEPKAEVKSPEVKTTRENLEVPVKGEAAERDRIYPEFLKRAARAQDWDAVQTFRYALLAETEHARLFGEALKNLEQWKGEPRVFSDCRTCGYTVSKPDFEQCPVCFSPADNFREVRKE